MPYIPYPDFCGPAYGFAADTGSLDLSTDEAINCLFQSNEARSGKGGPGLLNRPGYSLFSSPASPGVGRQLWAGEQRLFCVVDTKLIEVSSSGVQTPSTGNVGSGAGICGISSNTLSSGGMLGIVNPNTDTLYVDVGGTVSAATTPAGARMFAFLNGFGYIVAPNTNNVYQSAALDFTSWAALDQEMFVATDDRVVQILSDHDSLVMVGSAFTQFLYSAGNAGFTLQKVQSATIEMGTCAPYSVAKAGGMVCMVGGSRRGYGGVWAIRPGNKKRISNYAVEKSLRGVSDWGTVTGSGYESNGHDYYELYAPDLNLTWVYDFTENCWHKRRHWTGSAYAKMLGRLTQCTFNNNYYVISPTDGKIYKQLDDGLFADAGIPQRAQRTAPILYSNRNDSFNAFRLDMQTGDGSTTVGANMRYSVDGGKNYSAYGYEIMGRNGEPNVLEWPQLGAAGIRGFVADCYFDQGPFAVGGASVDLTVGLP